MREKEKVKVNGRLWSSLNLVVLFAELRQFLEDQAQGSDVIDWSLAVAAMEVDPYTLYIYMFTLALHL